MRRLVAWALASAVAVAGYACGSSPVSPQTAPAAAASQPARVPGEYLVTLTVPPDARVIRDVYGRFGIKSIQELGSNVFLVTLVEDPGPETMVKLRAEHLRIKSVEPNFVYRIQ